MLSMTISCFDRQHHALNICILPPPPPPSSAGSFLRHLASFSVCSFAGSFIGRSSFFLHSSVYIYFPLLDDDSGVPVHWRLRRHRHLRLLLHWSEKATQWKIPLWCVPVIASFSRVLLACLVAAIWSPIAILSFALRERLVDLPAWHSARAASRCDIRILMPFEDRRHRTPDRQTDYDSFWCWCSQTDSEPGTHAASTTTTICFSVSLSQKAFPFFVVVCDHWANYS